MKLFVFFILITLSSLALGLTPEEILSTEELKTILFSELRLQKDELKKVKYHLMNGDVRMAKVYLTKLAYAHSKLRPIINRYLALLSFTESDFAKTHEYLSLPELQHIPLYGKICVLKILSQIGLNKLNDLEDNWRKCKIENRNDFRLGNLIWMETLIQMKLNNNLEIRKEPFQSLRIAALELDETKVMLKLAMYLNQEKLLAEQLSSLSIEQMKDPEIRELAGQIFFRTGSLVKAYRFVEDLKSPNSENIKGNIYLLRTKYELAYAQFKLAVEQKQNSQNALERLLPLAWILGDWEGGAKYAEQILSSPDTHVNKLTIMGAFYMQKGDYKKVHQVFSALTDRSRKGTEIEVTQIAGLTALMENKPEMVRKQSLLSCDQFDLINCWILFQMTQWDSFPLMLRREDKLSEKREWEKLTNEDFNVPLNEKVFVNQKDIEELDDKLIQLIPQT